MDKLHERKHFPATIETVLQLKKSSFRIFNYCPRGSRLRALYTVILMYLRFILSTLRRCITTIIVVHIIINRMRASYINKSNVFRLIGFRLINYVMQGNHYFS